MATEDHKPIFTRAAAWVGFFAYVALALIVVFALI